MLKRAINNIITWVRTNAIEVEKENFYLLTCRIIDRIDSADTFEELDSAKEEFITAYRQYNTHEDFGEGYTTVLGAIANKTNELHQINFI